MMKKETQNELHLEWEKLISDFEQSGLTRNEWCEKHNKTVNQLRYWRENLISNRKKTEKSNKIAEHNGWVAVSESASEEVDAIATESRINDSGISIDLNSLMVMINNNVNVSTLTGVLEAIKNVR